MTITLAITILNLLIKDGPTLWEAITSVAQTIEDHVKENGAAAMTTPLSAEREAAIRNIAPTWTNPNTGEEVLL